MSSFKTLDHDPTSDHIKIVSEWANKLFRKGEISKDWILYIIKDAQLGKNPTLTGKRGNKEITNNKTQTHKQGDLVQLLATGCNTAIENLSRFIKIRGTSYFIDISDTLIQ